MDRAPTIRPFIPADVAKKSANEIEAWAEKYVLNLFDLVAELQLKVVPMFWGVAFGWEMATGYPWGFWAGPGYDLFAEGKERFVKKTQKIRDHARKLGIKLCHEIHPGTAASTADDFNMLVQICDGDETLGGQRGSFALLGRRELGKALYDGRPADLGGAREEFRRFGQDSRCAPWNRTGQIARCSSPICRAAI